MKTCMRRHTAILCGVNTRSALPVPPADAESANPAPPPTPVNRLMAPPAVAAEDKSFEKISSFWLEDETTYGPKIGSWKHVWAS